MLVVNVRCGKGRDMTRGMIMLCNSVRAVCVGVLFTYPYHVEPTLSKAQQPKFFLYVTAASAPSILSPSMRHSQLQIFPEPVVSPLDISLFASSTARRSSGLRWRKRSPILFVLGTLCLVPARRDHDRFPSERCAFHPLALSRCLVPCVLEHLPSAVC